MLRIVKDTHRLFCFHLRARFEDDEVGSYVRDKMFGQLPETWQEISYNYTELEHKAKQDETGASDPVVNEGKMDFNGLWFFGAKDNTVQAGLDSSGIGNLRLCVTWL